MLFLCDLSAGFIEVVVLTDLPAGFIGVVILLWHLVGIMSCTVDAGNARKGYQG